MAKMTFPEHRFTFCNILCSIGYRGPSARHVRANFSEQQFNDGDKGVLYNGDHETEHQIHPDDSEDQKTD